MEGDNEVEEEEQEEVGKFGGLEGLYEGYVGEEQDFVTVSQSYHPVCYVGGQSCSAGITGSQLRGSMPTITISMKTSSSKRRKNRTP